MPRHHIFFSDLVLETSNQQLSPTKRCVGVVARDLPLAGTALRVGGNLGGNLVGVVVYDPLGRCWWLMDGEHT